MNYNKNFITNPAEIEKKSFEIIAELLKDKKPLGKNAPVIQRVIHTTADLDYVDHLVFSENVLEQSIEILKQGVRVVTDTQMVKAGINKNCLEKLKGTVSCFVDSPEVAELAKMKGVTRSSISMEFAVQKISPP
ncbi:MAG: precorrin-8X methylmutase, partial [Planctomycetaceae bacterium]|nr:precorrin-8X methylmutase [Planctomycetaceae bacterium]